jgi:hypothetical protein
LLVTFFPYLQWFLVTFFYWIAENSLNLFL